MMLHQAEAKSLHPVAAVLKLASNHIRRRCWEAKKSPSPAPEPEHLNLAKLRFPACRARQNSPDGSLNYSHRHGYLQELSIRKNAVEKVDGVECAKV